MEVIRGRLLLGGIRHLSLSDFCNVVWLEIWNDCSPMGDMHQYRRIVTELFIDGKDPYDIFYEVTEHDKKGKPIKKQKRLANAPTSVSRGQRLSTGMDLLAEWKARAAELKQAQQVALPADG